MRANLLEKETLEAAKKGDLEAFEKIALVYEKPIYSYIFRLVGQKEDAEDLTQETFVRIYKSIEFADPEKNFKAWIYKIATNNVYSWFRRKKSRPELFIIDDKNSNFETIDPESTYYNIEARYDIESALANIKPEYKMVLFLFYWQDMSYGEIAEITSLPANTVKTYLHRGKIAMAKEINKSEKINKNYGKNQRNV